MIALLTRLTCCSKFSNRLLWGHGTILFLLTVLIWNHRALIARTFGGSRLLLQIVRAISFVNFLALCSESISLQGPVDCIWRRLLWILRGIITSRAYVKIACLLKDSQVANFSGTIHDLRIDILVVRFFIFRESLSASVDQGEIFWRCDAHGGDRWKSARAANS